MRTDENEEFVTCRFCHDQFFEVSNFAKHLIYNHLREHLPHLVWDTVEESMGCGSCILKFDDQELRITHWLVAHNHLNEVTTSNSCGKENYQNKHQTHDESKQRRIPEFHSCPICPYNYFNQLDLKRHLIDNHLRKKRNLIEERCVRCLKRFSNSVIASRHYFVSHFELSEVIKEDLKIEFNLCPKTHQDTFEVSSLDITTLEDLPVHTFQDVLEKIICHFCGKMFESKEKKLEHVYHHFSTDQSEDETFTKLLSEMENEIGYILLYNYADGSKENLINIDVYQHCMRDDILIDVNPNTMEIHDKIDDIASEYIKMTGESVKSLIETKVFKKVAVKKSRVKPTTFYPYKHSQFGVIFFINPETLEFAPLNLQTQRARVYIEKCEDPKEAAKALLMTNTITRMA